jgi:pimeloyl-ACP methyl ester carboxylesterase
MRLHFQVLGEGRPLLLLHGLFGSGDNLLGLARPLSKQFRCFLPDLRNHGSSPHDAEMSHPSMAADVQELIASENLTDAVLIGHSMGGKTAMQLALTAPSIVKALVILDVAPKAYGARHDQIIQALSSVPLERCRSRQNVDDFLSSAIPETAVRRFLLKSLRVDTAGELSWRLNLDAIHYNYSALNDAPHPGRPFDGPTLFLTGERSDYVTPSDHRRIHEWFPQAVLRGIPNAGHWLHAEAPERVLQEITSFLQDDRLALG